MTTEHDEAADHMGLHRVISEAVDELVATEHVTQAAAFEMLVHGPADSLEHVRDEAARVVRESHR